MSIFSKDPENTEAADLQRKLEMLNNMMDQEARAEQARRQILYNIGHCKYPPSHCLSGCCFIRILSLTREERPRSIVTHDAVQPRATVTCANFIFLFERQYHAFVRCWPIVDYLSFRAPEIFVFDGQRGY